MSQSQQYGIRVGWGVVKKEGWKGGSVPVWHGQGRYEVASCWAETQAKAGFSLCREHVSSPPACSQSPRCGFSKSLSPLGSRFSLCKENRLNLKSLYGPSCLESRFPSVWDHEEWVQGPVWKGGLCSTRNPALGARHHGFFTGLMGLWTQRVFVLSPVGIIETRNMATGVSSFTNHASLFKGWVSN